MGAYLASKALQRPKFVFALYGHEGLHYTRSKVDIMLNEVIGYMANSHWQTVLAGRPLVPVLWPSQFEEMLSSASDPSERMSLSGFVAHIRDRVKSASLPDPYVV